MDEWVPRACLELGARMMHQLFGRYYVAHVAPGKRDELWAYAQGDEQFRMSLDTLARHLTELGLDPSFRPIALYEDAMRDAILVVFESPRFPLVDEGSELPRFRVLTEYVEYRGADGEYRTRTAYVIADPDGTIPAHPIG